MSRHDHPGGSRGQSPGVWLVLAILLGALLVLVETHTATLLAWTARCIPLSRYPALFAAFYLTWLGARYARGPLDRRCALLVGSVVTAEIFDPLFAALSLIWFVALHRILFSAARHRVRYALLFVVASYVALAVACNRDLWPDFPAQHRFVARWGYVFALAYTFRIAWLLHQVRVQGTERVALTDFVTYFLFAPFFVIVPYMMAIPRCDRFCAGLDRHDRAVERSGLRLIAWGIALTLSEAAISHLYDPTAAGLAALQAHHLVAALGHGLIAYPPFAILRACAIAAILVGLVRVLGIELGPSFDRPALARSITDWWRRWNTHFRDLLVDLFYYPVVMARRRTPVRATVLGCAAVFLFGSTLLHWPKQYFNFGSLAGIPIGGFVENVIMFVAVSIALVREQRDPDRRPHRVLGPLFTWLLVFASVTVANGGVLTAWRAYVGLPDITPRFSDVFPFF